MLIRLRKVADGLIGLSASIGALALLFLMAVILIDVIGRAFGHPLYGSHDFVTMFMVVIVFGAMALCDRNGGHIAVDLFERRYSEALNRAIDIAVAAFGVVIFVALAWATYDSAKISVMLNLSTNLLNLPKSWFQHALSLFCLVTAFGLLLRALELSLAGLDIRPINGAEGLSASTIGVLGLVVMFVLLALRVPVAFAMFGVGFAGIYLLNDWSAAWSLLASEAFTLGSSPELVVIPLFILMGNVASHSGMSRKLYDAAYSVIGSVRGGLASATVIGCGGFAALSGSSVASALTMGKVALSEMDRFDYDTRLSTGVVAAGGTLGILIPPSTGFVIYAILTEQSIGRLFLAGVFPGILLTLLFILAITVLCWFRPAYGPSGPSTTGLQKLRALLGAGPIVGVILLTIGGMYIGLFSPVEAAAVGAAVVIALAGISGRLTLAMLWRSARDAVVTTATVMLILIAAHMINPFLALSHIPDAVGTFLNGLNLGVTGTLIVILAFYLVLGCFLEGFAMLVLTLPIFFPVILALGIDPIWFGVLVVLTLEMGLISPPVGINVFIVKSVAPKAELAQIFRGVLPFWLMMILCVGILIAFPGIALFLPNSMFN